MKMLTVGVKPEITFLTVIPLPMLPNYMKPKGSHHIIFHPTLLAFKHLSFIMKVFVLREFRDCQE